ncbi:MAG TPA: hypothetical protein VNM37_09150, partial [Candidatus Dormibacteraeota bacterium]|nr:hypothetical protein [Candidatus Dormibacteraeota bacterium]
MSARFDFGQLKSEQGAFGIDQVEKIEPAGEVSGPGDVEGLAGFGQEALDQQFESSTGLAKQERFLGKLDRQRDLFRGEPCLGCPLACLRRRHFRLSFIAPDGERDGQLRGVNHRRR